MEVNNWFNEENVVVDLKWNFWVTNWKIVKFLSENLLSNRTKTNFFSFLSTIFYSRILSFIIITIQVSIKYYKYRTDTYKFTFRLIETLSVRYAHNNNFPALWFGCKIEEIKLITDSHRVPGTYPLSLCYTIEWNLF